MKINSNEISSVIKELIKHFDDKIEANDVGSVMSIGDGIALVFGLDKCMLGELLLFPNNVYGMVMNLEENAVGVALLGSDNLIKEGDKVTRTKQVVAVPVGDGLLGRVVDSLGNAIDGGESIKYKNTRPVENIAPGVMERESVNTALQTGIKVIDAIIPIGKGQRELIIGDRQTGKTAIALDTIINQKGNNVKCIYVAIGQKNSSVASLVSKLREHNALEYTVILNASASSSAPLQYIAPYAGMAMAEEWLSKGEDVLIIFDDLSKHAVSYRALSLLLRRPPGREAYPGDVFYLHSRLLERACKLNKANGGGSITALPIVETQAGDISAYIPTNVISITDGQIFLVTDLFNAGQRPAVDSGFSVSRVGSNAQIKAMKKVASSFKIDLATYGELQAFSQFGSDLEEGTKKILAHGAVLMESLKQSQYSPLPVHMQVIELFIVKNKFLDEMELKEVRPMIKDICSHIQSSHKQILNSIIKTQDLTDDNKEQLTQVIKDYINIKKKK